MRAALQWVVRAWIASLRVRVVRHPRLAAVDADRWVIAFLHADLVGMVAWPRRRTTAALVSGSSDGDWLAGVLGAMKRVAVVRGSSSRGGARGLRALIRVARQGAVDCAFAVDGPRGPRGRVHGGVVTCARALGAVLVPLRLEARASLSLGTWDRAVVPLPFARITITLGAPLEAARPDAGVLLAAALAERDAMGGGAGALPSFGS